MGPTFRSILAIALTRSALALTGGALALAGPAWASDFLMDEHTSQSEDPLMAEELHRDFFTGVHDIRLGGGIYQKPHVFEKVTTPAGGTAEYSWIGGNPIGHRISISGVATPWQVSRSLGDPLFGLELSYSAYEETPTTYRVGGTYSTNLRQDVTLQYQTGEVSAVIGWATPRWYTRAGDLHLELAAVIGGGFAWADTQGINAAGQVVRRRGSGWDYNVGPRLGIYLCDSGWVFGIHGDWVFSHGEVGIDLPNGDHSELSVDGDGFGGEGQIGYRF